MRSFLVSFLLILLVLSFVGNYEPIRALLVDPWNDWLALGSFAIMHWLGAAVGVSGNVLFPLHGAGGVAIESGCNGIEAIILLVSAILAFPASWSAKLLGILVGAFLVQSLNLLRIISLYYLVSWNQSIFDWFHLYVWPVLIVIDALVIFFIWTRWLARRAKPA